MNFIPKPLTVFGLGPSLYAPYRTVTESPPQVAGWAKGTTEPALGPNDRLNTTDVPEEIEAKPDKSEICRC